MDEDIRKISIILPTLNAGKSLPGLIDTMRRQSLQPLEIIVVDSGSSDGTAETARAAGWVVTKIPGSDFQHGRARNLGAGLARGELLVFLTQDVLPADEQFLANLVRPLIENKASASAARQVASPGASPLETYARETNYPAQSSIRSAEDIQSMGVMAYFFSNAASAVDRATFEALGGFPQDVIVNEDMLFCARLLRAGQRVAYQAEALVYHAHDYSLREQFQRYFDIGVFFSQAAAELGAVQPGGRGVRFALGQIGYLLKRGLWFWIPRAVAESALKFLGFSLGKRSRHLPRGLRRAFSRQKTHWDRAAAA
jgi:rhamnosyltransferase